MHIRLPTTPYVCCCITFAALPCVKFGELWSTNSGDYSDYLATIYARNAFESLDSYSAVEPLNG